MLRDFRRLIVLSTIPTVVELSICIGVGGSGCPNYCNVQHINFACLVFKNSDPSSASAADAETHFEIEHMTCMAPLSLIGCPSIGIFPREKITCSKTLCIWRSQV